MNDALPPDRPPRWDRRALATLAVLVAGTAVVGQLWGHGLFDARNDAALYVLTARALAAGEGYSYLGEPFTLRPPGFSLLLAPLVGTGEPDFALLNLAVRASGVACAALLFALLRARLGDGLAALAAAVVFVNQGFQTLSNQVLSDVPGLALTLACLLAARRSRGAGGDALTGAAIGLAALVRSSALLAVPAVAAARVLGRLRPPPDAERGPGGWPAVARRVAALVLGAALVVAPWSARNAARQSPDAADQTFMHSYSTAMWHVDAGDPESPAIGVAGLLERAATRWRELLSTLGSRLARSDGRPGDLVLGTLALAAAGLVLARRRAPPELYLLATCGVLLVYFGFRERLVLPVWVLALAACVEAVLVLGGGRRGARWAAAALLFALGLSDAGPPGLSPEAREAARDAERAAAWIAEHVPADQTVAATQGWELGVHLPGRRVYSLQRAFRRDGPAGLERVLGRHDVRVCAIDRRDVLAAPIGRALGGRPLAELGPWVLVRIGDRAPGG